VVSDDYSATTSSGYSTTDAISGYSTTGKISGYSSTGAISYSGAGGFF